MTVTGSGPRRSLQAFAFKDCGLRRQAAPDEYRRLLDRRLIRSLRNRMPRWSQIDFLDVKPEMGIDEGGANSRRLGRDPWCALDALVADLGICLPSRAIRSRASGVVL